MASSVLLTALAALEVSAIQLVVWTGGVLTAQDLEAFLWGDNDRILTASAASDTFSGTRDQQERLYLTAYTLERYGEMPAGNSASLGPPMETCFKKYLIWRWLNENTPTNKTVAPSVLENIYKTQLDRYRQEPQFTFRRLFFPTHELEEARGQEQQRILAEGAVQRLRSGEPFEQVLEQLELDPRCRDVLGPFAYGKINAVIENAVRELDRNEISDVLELDWGFQIIQLIDKRPARLIPFDEVRADLALEYQRNCRSKILQSFLDSARPPASEHGADGVLLLFFGKELRRQVTAEEAAVLYRKILDQVRQSGMDQDPDSCFVHDWLLKCQVADDTFEKMFQERFRGTDKEAALRQYYDEHPEYFRGKSRFQAEFVTIAVENDSANPASSFLAKTAAEKKARQLAEDWRNGRWSPTDAAALDDAGVVYHPVTEPLDIAQAGRQLSEAVRGLKPGQIGDPVYSAAHNTFLVARLLEQIPGALKPFDPADAHIRQMYRGTKKKEFRKAFVEEAMGQIDPKGLMPN